MQASCIDYSAYGRRWETWKYEYTLVVQLYMIWKGRNMWRATYHNKNQFKAGQSMQVDEYHDNLGEISHIVNRIMSLTVSCCSHLTLIFLLARPLLLLLSSRRAYSSFGNGRLPSWLQFLRQSRLKREAVRLPSWMQFIDCLGRPGLPNATVNTIIARYSSAIK